MLVQEPVHAAIWHCLNHYAYRDATFLAERLYTEVSSDESLHLLATCYYRSGQVHQAYDILSKNDSCTAENRFLLAKCCVDLEKTHEAELSIVQDVLDPKQARSDPLDEVVAQFGDLACFALQMLATLYTSTERLPRANEADRKALKLNPLLWKSFEALCRRGDFPDPKSIFNADKIEDLDQCQGTNHVIDFANRAESGLQHMICQQQPSGQPSAAKSLMTTPSFSGSKASSTSTPIPISNVQLLPQNKALPVILVTPVGTPLNQSTEGSDSCFTNSPAPPPRLAMSGIGMLSASSSDLEKSTFNEGCVNLAGRTAMPPPPVKPKQLRRIQPNALAFSDSSTTTPPSSGTAKECSFGRFPRGALIWSNGKPEQLQPAQQPGLQGARLDFSPQSILSPHSTNNPTTPLQSGSSENQPQTSSAPLFNATNSDHKIKRSLMENTTPLKQQALFGGQTNQNQNTPANSNTNAGSNVRRSSRLFGSTQQQSIKAKENSKTPVTAPGGGQHLSPKTSKNFKSPNSKKGNKRPGSKQPSAAAAANQSDQKSSDLNEMNEKNKLMDTVESSTNMAAPPAGLQAAPYSRLMTEDCYESKTKDQIVSLQKHSLEGLLALLQQLGEAHLALAKFKCNKAIQLFEDISPDHKNTAWVLGSLGKAHFELGNYVSAKVLFQEMRDVDPYRKEFTEYLSTTLWHLQDEVELSALAQDLTSGDKMSPQAWCAAGNCFSLQKEHENAIKFFQRAAQVNPNFAYSYTFLGHEYITIEELDKALTCFRTAARLDPRHYNAWYGIGLVFFKQERFQLAEIYFRKAVDINPQSPALMCHLAVVQHALQKTDKALETLDQALRGSPKNALCKFERASILFSSERYQEALNELNQLKILVPKESPVYFLMGKVYNKLNDTHLALMHFSWAMDLDPKGANSQIKDALDRSMNKAAQETVELTNAEAAVQALHSQDLPMIEDDEDEDEEMLMQDDNNIERM